MTPSRRMLLGWSNCPIMLASARNERFCFSEQPARRVCIATGSSLLLGSFKQPLQISPYSPEIQWRFENSIYHQAICKFITEHQITEVFVLIEGTETLLSCLYVLWIHLDNSYNIIRLAFTIILLSSVSMSPVSMKTHLISYLCSVLWQGHLVPMAKMPNCDPTHGYNNKHQNWCQFMQK